MATTYVTVAQLNNVISKVDTNFSKKKDTLKSITIEDLLAVDGKVSVDGTYLVEEYNDSTADNPHIDYIKLDLGGELNIVDKYSDIDVANYNLDTIIFVTNDETINDIKYVKGTYFYNNDDDSVSLVSSLSSSALEYEEEILTKNDVWTIQHNLNFPYYKLSITCLDDDMNYVQGDIDVANSTNNLIIINFDEPIKGKIYIKK